jgi:uncharacterized protein YuzE
MRVRYNRRADILTLELSDAPIVHAEEAGPLIVHFTEDDRLVVLEILEASDFLAKLTKEAMQADRKRAVEV